MINKPSKISLKQLDSTTEVLSSTLSGSELAMQGLSVGFQTLNTKAELQVDTLKSKFVLALEFVRLVIPSLTIALQLLLEIAKCEIWRSCDGGEPAEIMFGLLKLFLKSITIILKFALTIFLLHFQMLLLTSNLGM